jgi:hypothetical protein
MAVPKRVLEAKGLWKGQSQLNLPWLPPDKRVTESKSQLHVDTDAGDHYATITYTWEYEGKPQEGTMIVCMANKTKAVQIGWVDSWHENSEVLHLVGTEAESGEVRTKGSYGDPKEPWGWTINLDLVGGKLLLTMENIPHGSEPQWAVKGTYEKDS